MPDSRSDLSCAVGPCCSVFREIEREHGAGSRPSKRGLSSGGAPEPAGGAGIVAHDVAGGS